MKLNSNFFILLTFLLHKNSTYALPTIEKALNSSESDIYSHQLGYVIADCLGKSEVSRCFKKRTIESLELAIKDNNTWDINPYLSMDKNIDWKPKHVVQTNKSDLSDIIVDKMKDLVESRSIRVNLIPKSLDEGRKKKDKGGAMIGGMVMVGVMAQMFMGKVLMLAGAAFLFSKLALMFSIISGLKKSGGGSDHVIYTEGGGGGGHGSGWNRQYATGYPDENLVQKKQLYI